VRHKRFLKQLEKQKNLEREDMLLQQNEKDNKTKAFKEAAARQREKIKGLKTNDVQQQNDDMMMASMPEHEENI